ncbi:pyridoxal kinase, partial [Micromonospora sp. M51]|nr:pyridoxal kinase [Micromonospora sp. M51]
VTAALYLAHLCTTGSPATALERTIASVYAVLEATVAAGTREIQLIAAQDVIADPPTRFAARRLR